MVAELLEYLLKNAIIKDYTNTLMKTSATYLIKTLRKLT